MSHLEQRKLAKLVAQIRPDERPPHRPRARAGGDCGDGMTKPAGFQPSFRISNRVTAGLTRIERARGFLDAAKLSEDWLATMRSRALLLEAHHTTHIEGTRLTLEQAERLFAGQAVPEADPDDARRAFELSRRFRVRQRLSERWRADHRGVDPRDSSAAGRWACAAASAHPGEYRRVQNLRRRTRTPARSSTLHRRRWTCRR